MLQKLWHKKWMNCCLLLGSLLLIATVVSFPLYQTAAYDRMLRDEFRNYVSSTGEWPTINSMLMLAKKDAGGSTISRVESVLETICSGLGVSLRENIYYYLLADAQV